MSNETPRQDDPDKEIKVLKAMKMTLTNVIKDTTTEPGLKHPLSESTINDIRQCLALITSREHEISPQGQRPRFIDEPEDKVVVSLQTPGKKDS